MVGRADDDVQISKIMTKRLLLETRGLLRETRKDGVSDKKLRGSDRKQSLGIVR